MSKVSILVSEGAQRCANAVMGYYAVECLSRSQRLILSRTIWLSAYHALTNQRVTRSCWPSRRYLAGAVKLSISTVSRITSGLARGGAISKFQRRPVLSQFQTCLYKIEGDIWRVIKPIIMNFLLLINRVLSMQHIVSKDIVLYQSKKKKSDFPIKLKDPPGKMPWETLFERHPELA